MPWNTRRKNGITHKNNELCTGEDIEPGFDATDAATRSE